MNHWKDIQNACLEDGYVKLADDPEYKTRPRRKFTQNDLDEAYQNGWLKGYESGYWDGQNDG